MKNRILKLLILSATAMSLAVLPASATSFDFWKLDKNGSGVGDFTPDAPITYLGGDAVSTVGGSLAYTVDGITATATGMSGQDAAAVVQDSDSGRTYENSAGLGVYTTLTPVNYGDDNITIGETLTIKFSEVVHITQLGFRGAAHNFTSWIADATFLLNGVSTLLPLGTGVINGSWNTDEITIAYGGENPDQLYLASINVPDTGATIALLGLGLFGLGAAARRYKK